nr:uncharacterized protein LOC101240985 isoform X1 [Hydra vulgaris]
MNVKFIFFLVLMVWSLETFLAEKNEVCNEGIVDIGFIMDSSGSLGKNYKNEKDLLKTLASLFSIKPNGSQAGVITFSFYTEHSIKLNQFSDQDSFNDAVDRIPLMGHTTRIDKGLRLAQKEMFKVENGGRPGVSKLLVLLTDGSQTQGKGVIDPAIIADEIRKQGVPIIAIGIGKEINKNELIKIGGGEANTYSADDFEKLKESDFIQNLKKGVCVTASELPIESITDLDASTKLTEGRSFNTDVVFAMDLSSASDDILQKQKRIVRSLTKYLLPSKSNELGLITYSDIGNVDSELSPKFNNEILDKIENNGRRQNVGSAITVASDDIFKKRNNDEKLKKKQRVLVLFVVGKPSSSNPPVVPERYGKMLQENNVRTVIIGLDEIGDDFNKNMPGSKLLKYSEDKTPNELKGLMQGWHDMAEGRSFNTDVVFAIDLSSSSDDILQKQKRIVRSLTEYLLPSKSNELGLITYSDIGNVDSELSPKFNNEILDKIENNGRRQNVGSAITVASDDIFKKRNNDEKLKKKQRVLVLFVVGKPSSSNPPVVPERYGKLLQENNVRTVIIGLDEVGDDFNKNVPGSKLLKYSEDKTPNELKELMQGWHDMAEGRAFNVDMVFAMDLSSSSEEILQKQKKAIRSLIDYHLPSKSNELGLITYSDIANVNSELTSKFNSEILDKIVNNGRRQNVASAITVASENIFKIRNNDEKLKKKQRVLVLFVVGKPSSNYPPVVPERYGKLLQENNVKTIIIGLDDVGDDFNKNIPGSKLSKYSENDTANELKGFVQGVHDGAEGRAFNVDMVFAMDLSSSSEEILQKQKKAIRSLIDYHLPSKSNELGLITYSDIANVNSELTSKFNSEILDKIVNNGRRQNVASAITVASENIFKIRNNDEKLKKKQRVLVLFVVGKPSSNYPPVVPERYGKLLEENNVKTIIIGLDDVGDDFNKNIPGSKLSKYSENDTANELKGFVQGVHDGAEGRAFNVDMVFAMDLSSSSEEILQKQKKAIRSLIDYHLPSKSNELGLITYSDIANVNSELTSKFNSEILDKIVNNGRRQNVASAITVASENIFKIRNNDEKLKKKQRVLVLFVVGKPSSNYPPVVPERYGKLLEENNVKTIIIGLDDVGDDFNKNIPGSKLSKYSENDTANELKGFVQGVHDGAEGRAFNVDMVFAMDLSSSSEEILQKQKKAIRSLIDYHLPSKSNELGLITYSDIANVNSELTSKFNSEILDKIVNNGRRQNVASAITVASENIFKIRNNDEKLKKKQRVLVLFVVGKPSSNYPPVVPERYGKLLEENNVKTIIIGLDDVGDDFNKNIPGSKLSKYSENDTANELKGFVQGVHDGAEGRAFNVDMVFAMDLSSSSEEILQKQKKAIRSLIDYHLPSKSNELGLITYSDIANVNSELTSKFNSEILDKIVNNGRRQNVASAITVASENIFKIRNNDEKLKKKQRVLVLFVVGKPSSNYPPVVPERYGKLLEENNVKTIIIGLDDVGDDFNKNIPGSKLSKYSENDTANELKGFVQGVHDGAEGRAFNVDMVFAMDLSSSSEEILQKQKKAIRSLIDYHLPSKSNELGLITYSDIANVNSELTSKFNSEILDKIVNNGRRQNVASAITVASENIFKIRNNDEKLKKKQRVLVLFVVGKPSSNYPPVVPERYGKLLEENNVKTIIIGLDDVGDDFNKNIPGSKLSKYSENDTANELKGFVQGVHDGAEGRAFNVDMVFAMDLSSSSEEILQKQKKAIRSLIDYHLPSKSNELGLITYSDIANVNSELTSKFNSEILDKIVNNGRRQNVASAITVASENIFKIRNNDEKLKKKQRVLVLFVVGKPSSNYPPVVPERYGKLLEENNVKTIIIGLDDVGDDFNKNIPGSKLSKYSENDTANELKGFVQGVHDGAEGRAFNVDMVFAMDLSSSSEEILQKQKKAIRSLIDYHLPSKSNELGLITYSDIANVNSELTSKFNSEILDKIVNNGRRQNVASAITVASENIFKIRNNDEKLKKKQRVLVLFVVGKPSSNYPPVVPERYGKLLEENNVKTIIIGLDDVGDDFNKNIPGSKLSKYSENDTANELKGFVQGVHDGAEGRAFNVDMVFAMDLSSSSEEILQKQKKAIRSLIDYHLPSKSNELGLITYSDIANVNSELTSKFNSEILDKIVNNGRRQNVASAITVASENIFKIRNNDEKLKKKQRVLVLFVVGKPSSNYPPVVPERYGKLLEENNVKTIIIGLDDVGDDFNKNIPGSKLSKYSENDTANELKGFVQGVHDGAEGRAFNVDMVFAMDLSSSSEEILQKQKKAIRSLIDYHLPSKSNELGLITYSDIANVNSELTSKFNSEILDKIVNNGRRQNVASAITVASENIFKIRNNDEKLKKKQRVLVLFVVGKPSSNYPPVVPERYGKLLEENNVKTIIIGLDDVGDDFNKNIPGSKLSKYSENDTANELKGFVQGVHDGAEGRAFNVDMVFAMDLSSSSEEILQKQKKAIRSLIDYHLPSKSNELGLITYSDIANVNSELTSKFNSEILDKIVNNGRRQNVASAITVASENIFKIRNNDEKLKKKQRVLVLFVVGKPSSNYPPVVPERYGKLLEENNVKTIIIGLDDVGDDFNKNIPGSKLSKYSENDTANELKGFVQGVHDGAEGRAFNVDMVFAMDLSSSSEEILQKQKKAIRSLIDYHLPSKSNELGLITYSDIANVNSELTSKFNSEILDKIVNNGRRQNVASAITVASENIFKIRNNDEKLKKKQRVLVLFVVGKPSSNYPPVVPERYGKLLEENNVKTIIIGLDDVGDDFNKNIPGSKLSKYSENDTANELKGFVQGVHDGAEGRAFNVDMVFAMDLSSSSEEILQKQKKAIRSLIDYHLPSKSNELGLITYSDIANVNSELTSKFNSEILDKIVNNGRRQNVASAITVASENIFKIRNNDEKLKKKQRVLVLFVVGKPSSNYPPVVPERYGKLLEENNVKTIIIGLDDVGDDFNKNIPGSKLSKYSENDTANELKGFVQGVHDGAEGRAFNVDMVFAMDLSSSSEEILQKQKKAIRSLIDYHLPSKSNELGLITYSDIANVNSELTSKFNSEILDKIVNNGRRQNVASAITVASENIFKIRNNDEKLKKKQRVLVLFVVGKPSSNYPPVVPERYGKLLEENNVKTIIIGLDDVGDDFNKNIPGSKLSKYSENDTANELKGFVQGVHDGDLSNISNINQSILTPSNTTSGINQSTLTKGSNLTEGHCIKVNLHPLDKDIQIALNLLQSGMDKDWIVKFLQNTDSLEMILKYHKNLRHILSEFQPSLHRLGVFPEFDCKSKAVEKTLTSIFNYNEKSNILSKAREIGGGKFVDMLWATGLANEILNSNEDITLIVPLSISNIPDSIDIKKNSACSLVQMLKYHMIVGKNYVTNLKNNDILKSMNNAEIIYFNKFDQLSTLSGSVTNKIVLYNIEALGGVIHVVDNFMLPPDRDIISLLEKRNSFTIFTKALKESMLLPELKNSPHTYFVVADTNINKDYISELNSSEKIRNFIRRHTVSGLHFSHMLHNNAMLTAVDGSTVKIHHSGDKITVNGFPISTLDLISHSGIVHVIDNPL